MHNRYLTLLASAILPFGVHTSEDKHGDQAFENVAVFSVDGLHNSDIDTWLKKGSSNISMMLEHGYRYTNAYTPFPSDSFPGTLTLFTGATPITTGVWYDDVWDRSFYEPKSNCTGKAGAEGELKGTV